MSFKNKVVIVTGSSSGIGAATAIVFAREGADVVVTGRNEANLNSVADQCGQVGKRALIVKADISVESDAITVIEKTIEKFGKLDVLVNNAGILENCSILDKNAVEIFDKVINTNLRAVVVLTNKASPYLIRTKGNIVNVSSIGANTTEIGISSYCTSKAALNRFTRVIANELGPNGVRVNTVSPGPVKTPILNTSESDWTWDFLALKTALNKVSTPEEVGELIAYVASDKAVSITGSDLVIDCGYLVKS